MTTCQHGIGLGLVCPLCANRAWDIAGKTPVKNEAIAEAIAKLPPSWQECVRRAFAGNPVAQLQLATHLVQLEKRSDQYLRLAYPDTSGQ